MRVDIAASDHENVLANADNVEAAQVSSSVDGSHPSQPTLEDVHSYFDGVLEQALSDNGSPNRRRFGDVLGVVADQPLSQHVQGAASAAFDSARSAANTVLSPLRRPQN